MCNEYSKIRFNREIDHKFLEEWSNDLYGGQHFMTAIDFKMAELYHKLGEYQVRKWVRKAAVIEDQINLLNGLRHLARFMCKEDRNDR